MDRLVVVERPLAEGPEARDHGQGREEQEAGREPAGDPPPLAGGRERSGFVQRDSPLPPGAAPAGSRILETELVPELTT